MKIPKISLKADYFATVIVSLFFSAIAAVAIQLLTGGYILKAAGDLAPFVALALILAFTLLSSRFIFNYDFDDTFGLGAAFAIVEALFLVAGVLVASIIRYDLPANYAVNGLASLVLMSVGYTGILAWLFKALHIKNKK